MSLWKNIHKKRERIKRGSGEKMRKPGSKGAPKSSDFKTARGLFFEDLSLFIKLFILTSKYIEKEFCISIFLILLFVILPPPKDITQFS